MAHGLANAVLLPKVLRAYGEGVTKPLAELARAIGMGENNMSDKDLAEMIISHIEGMNRRMQIPDVLDCIRTGDIPEMAKHADNEGNPLYPVPVLWDGKELERLYYLVCPEEKK